MSDEEINRIVHGGEFRFEEAVSYFDKKVPVTAGVFYDLADHYRALAFTVSGYTEAQIIKKFYDELLDALENGTTMEQFRQSMSGFLERQGYEGLTPFQADNIFRTNIQTAYQAGHYEQMTDPDVMRLRPYWQYDAVNDSHTRPSHLAMDGRVFPADSPVWDTWYPPQWVPVPLYRHHAVSQAGQRAGAEGRNGSAPGCGHRGRQNRAGPSGSELPA